MLSAAGRAAIEHKRKRVSGLKDRGLSMEEDEVHATTFIHNKIGSTCREKEYERTVQDIRTRDRAGWVDAELEDILRSSYGLVWSAQWSVSRTNASPRGHM